MSLDRLADLISDLAEESGKARAAKNTSVSTLRDGQITSIESVPLVDDEGNPVLDDEGLSIVESRETLVIGQQPDGSNTIVHTTGVKPWTPSVPSCVGSVGSVSVTWDGRYMDDPETDVDESREAYADFQRVEVHGGAVGGSQALDTGIGSTTRWGTIETVSGGSVALSVPAGTYWVALVAVNRAGEYGEPSYSVNVVSEAGGGMTAEERQQIADAAAAVSALDGMVDEANQDIARLKTGEAVQALDVSKLTVLDASIDQAVANAIWTKALVANKIQAGQIAAGAISTSELAAGAVTAEKIYANAIRTEHIQSGAVTADAIQAGAITANKLAVGAVSGNLLPGGSFEDKTVRASAVSVGTNYFWDPSFTAWNTALFDTADLTAYPLTRTPVESLPVTAGFDIALGASAATMTVQTVNSAKTPAMYFFSTGPKQWFPIRPNNFFSVYHLSTGGVPYRSLTWVGVYDSAGAYLGDYDGSYYNLPASNGWTLNYMSFTEAQIKAQYPTAAKFVPAIAVYSSTGGTVAQGFTLHVTSVTVSDAPRYSYVYDNVISPISLQSSVENIPQGAIGYSPTTSLKMPSGISNPAGMSTSGSIFNVAGWTMESDYVTSSTYVPGIAYVTHSGGSSGTGALALRGIALSDTTEGSSRATSTGFDVTPHQGGSLVVSAKVRSYFYAGGLGSALRVSVLFKDGAGSVVTSAATATTTPSSISSWAPVAWIIQVPADAVTAQVQLIQPNSKSVSRFEPVYVDEVAVYPQGQNTSDLSGIGLRMWDDQGNQGVYITPQQTTLNNPVTIGGSLSINGNTDINGTMYWTHQGNKAGRVSSDNNGVSLGAYRNDNSGVLLHGVWVNRGTGMVTFPNGVDLTGDGSREATVPLPAGWANYGSDGSGSYIPLRVQSLGVKTAVLHGMIKVSAAAAAGSLAATPVGTLPAWACPRENALTFVTLSNKSVVRVGVYADGRLMIYHVDAMTVNSYGAFSLTYPL